MYTISFLFLILIITHGESRQEIDESINASGAVENRVFGGLRTKKGDFPYVAVLFLDTPKFSHVACTASIIDAKWILTAGHCLDERIDASQYFVIIGEVIASKNSTMHPVENFYIHPKFNLTLTDIPLGEPEDIPDIVKKQLRNETKEIDLNDMGLLKLKEKLKWSSSVTPIGLGPVDDKSHVEVIYAGYGMENYQDKRETRRLNYLTLRTVEFEKCATKYYWGILLEEKTQFCAFKGPEETPYLGDSGGPLVDTKSGKQVGLLCSIMTLAEGYPSVYTRISHFLPWIREVTGLTLEEN